MPTRTRIAAIIAVAWLFLAAAPARADQNDLRLDALFDTLQNTQASEATQEAERLIWNIWSVREGDATLNQMMKRGLVEMNRRRLQSAVEIFTLMIRHAPDFAEGWNKRATVFYLMGAFSRSVLDIERTLDLEPRHFGALSGLGLIYLAVDKPAGALKAFDAALAINPHMPGPRRHTEELREQLKGKSL